MSDTPEKEHIVMLKKALQRMYENGYDATCDAIEDTLSEREDLLNENARLRAAMDKYSEDEMLCDKKI
jgi:hypothetical protein